MSSSSQRPQARPARISPSRSTPSSPPSTNTTAAANSSSSVTVDADASVTIPLSAPRSTSSPTNAVARSPSPRQQDDDEKRCWICYTSAADSDQPKERSEWKSPCKCSLVAHESCLLDWIADVQLNRRESGSQRRLECPQCKTPIRLKEKDSAVLDFVDSVSQLAGNAGAFVAFGGLASVIFVSATVYGVNTIYTICGPEFAEQILLNRETNQFLWSWRTGVGLPLIPVVLVASRTRIFDSVLPVLPVIFFAQSDPLHFTLPPSPQITLALLPYLRSFYNHLWGKYISPYEQRWLREVTPRHKLESEARRARERAVRRNRDWDALRQRDNAQRNNQNQRQQQQAVQEEDGVIVEEREWGGELLVDNHNVIIQGNNLTTLVLGALLWPSVARLAGQGIGKWPSQWGGDKIRKWLPSLLARNLVGGLLVVVMKDFISLYCKYKRAQKFRSRTVMNYSEVMKLAQHASKARRATRNSNTNGNAAR
ncbi:hypothetical protein EX30DRAFT_331021 [Ascodesmis nigricans]|uniref:RING-CH-type domain-containing protein n=1 Tax=Ascodesmis nigricans TaxID=341454 RepID=A0A4S2MXQ2_9PEZI|nr:hypothetical protein EX30DRAFT_331021 [Ascodesmis nigricans]